MLSRRVKVSSRLNSWNTKPRFSRRNAARALSFSPARSRPSNRTLPPVGRSSVARMFSSVVFPEPDSPMMATYSPASTEKLTPFSARTGLAPKRPE